MVKPKIFWIASGILLAIVLTLNFNFHSLTVPGSDTPQSLLDVLDALSTVVICFIFGILPTLILAFIPFKGWPFRKRFNALLPILMFIVLLLMAGSIVYLQYQAQVNGIYISP